MALAIYGSFNVRCLLGEGDSIKQLLLELFNSFWYEAFLVANPTQILSVVSPPT